MENTSQKINGTKKRILVKSEELFNENGYDKTTVNDICEACNITRSTFYYYFSNKDEILDYYIIVSSDIVNDNLSSIMLLPGYYEKFWEMYKLICKRLLKTGKEMMGQVFKRAIDVNQEIFNFKNFYQYDLFLSLITEAQKNKEILNPYPPKDIMDSFMCLADGIVLVWCTSNDDFDLIKENQKMVETLFVVNKD